MERFALAYAARRRDRRLLDYGGTIANAILVMIGWYYVTSWRTMVFGMSLRSVLGCAVAAVLVVGLPSLIIELLQRSPRLWRPAICSLVVVVAAELWSATEECIVVWTHGTTPATSLSIRREWPFHDYTMEYQPGIGWDAQD